MATVDRRAPLPLHPQPLARLRSIRNVFRRCILPIPSQQSSENLNHKTHVFLSTRTERIHSIKLFVCPRLSRRHNIGTAEHQYPLFTITLRMLPILIFQKTTRRPRNLVWPLNRFLARYSRSDIFQASSVDCRSTQGPTRSLSARQHTLVL